MCLNRISCSITLQMNVLTMTKHLKKKLLVRVQGKGCGASSVCKTEAHAYVWLTQEQTQTVFKRSCWKAFGKLESKGRHTKR